MNTPSKRKQMASTPSPHHTSVAAKKTRTIALGGGPPSAPTQARDHQRRSPLLPTPAKAAEGGASKPPGPNTNKATEKPRQPPRPNQVPRQTFAEAAQNALTLEIISTQEGTPLVQADIAHVQRHFLARLLTRGQNGPPPRINAMSLRDGRIVLACVDQATVDFVEDLARGLPARDGATHQYRTSRAVVLKARFPDQACAEGDNLRLLLQLQNPEIPVQEIRILSSQQAPQGDDVLVTLEVGQQALEALRRLDFRPFIGLSRVQFCRSVPGPPADSRGGAKGGGAS